MSWKQNQWDKQPTLSGKNNYTNTKASYEEVNFSKELSSMDASMGVITGILPQRFVPSLDEGIDNPPPEKELLQLKSHALSLVQKSGKETDIFDVEVGISGGRIRQFQNSDGVKNIAIIGNDSNNSRVILSTDLSSNLEGELDFSNSLVIDVCGNTVIGKSKGSATNDAQKNIVDDKFKLNVYGGTYMAIGSSWRDSVGTTSDNDFSNNPYTLFIDGNTRIRGIIDADTFNAKETSQVSNNIEVGGSIYIVGSGYDMSWNETYDANNYDFSYNTNDIGNQLDVNYFYYITQGGTDAEEGQLWVFNDVHFMSDMDVCGNARIGADISSNANVGYAEPRLTINQVLDDSLDTSAALVISTAQQENAAFAIMNSEDSSAWYMGGNTDFGWISADSSNVTSPLGGQHIYIAKNDGGSSGDANDPLRTKNAVAIWPNAGWNITRPLTVGHNSSHKSAFFGGAVEISRISETWQSDTFVGHNTGLMLHGGPDTQDSITNAISFTEGSWSENSKYGGQFAHVRFDLSGERQGFVLSSERGVDDGTGTYNYDFKDMAFFVRDGSDNTKFSTAGDPSLSQVDTWFPKYTLGIGDQPGGGFINGSNGNVGLTIMNNQLTDNQNQTFIQLGKEISDSNCGEIWYLLRDFNNGVDTPTMRFNLYGNKQNLSIFDNSCVGIGFGTDPYTNITTDINGNEASLAVNAVSSDNERPVLRILRDSSVGSSGVNTHMEQVSTSSDGGNRQIGWDTETTVYDQNGNERTGEKISIDGTHNAYFDITTTDSSNVPCYKIFQNKSGGKESKPNGAGGGGTGIIVQPVLGTGEQNIWFGKAATNADGFLTSDSSNPQPPFNPLGIVVDASGRVGVGMTTNTAISILAPNNPEHAMVSSTWMSGVPDSGTNLNNYQDYRFVVGAADYNNNHNYGVTTSVPYDQSYPMMSVGGYHTGRYTRLTGDPNYTLTDISYVSVYVTSAISSSLPTVIWELDASMAYPVSDISYVDTSGAVLLARGSPADTIGRIDPGPDTYIAAQIYGSSNGSSILLGSYVPDINATDPIAAQLLFTTNNDDDGLQIQLGYVSYTTDSNQNTVSEIVDGITIAQDGTVTANAFNATTSSGGSGTITAGSMTISTTPSDSDLYYVPNVAYVQSYVSTHSSSGGGSDVWEDNGSEIVPMSGVSQSVTITGTMTAGSFNATSDARVKENVEPIDQPLEIMKEIRGVTFNMKEDETKKKRIGVIAQELETILPDLVSEDSSGMKSVNYLDMIGLLVESVKELTARVEQLEKER